MARSLFSAPSTQGGGSLYASAPILVGGVLLVAAFLKAQRLFSETSVSSGILQSPWFLMLLIEAEAACGLALWLHIRPRLLRCIAMLMFAAFLGAALLQALVGAKSCACFGQIDLSPWAAMILDAAIVVVLYRWRPAEDRDRLARVTGSVYLSVIIPFIGFPMAWIVADHGRARSALEVTPSPLNLGVLARAEAVQNTIKIHNNSSETVFIGQIDTSCPCLRVRLAKSALKPGEDTEGIVILNMAEEPQYSGGLVVEIRFYSGGTNLLSRLLARATVKK